MVVKLLQQHVRQIMNLIGLFNNLLIYKFSAVGMSFRSGFSDCPPETANFKADRPFLFHVMDVTKNIILFSGRYMNPSESNLINHN